MELETWVHNDKKVKDMLNQLLIPSIPLAMLTKILKSPSLVDRYYNLFKKVNMNGLVIFYPID